MKRKQYLIRFLIFGIVFVSIFGILRTKRFFQIDSCLDFGGKWNYDLKHCEKSYILDSVVIPEFYWHSNFDKKLNVEYLKRGKMLDSISQSPNELIEILNHRPAKCKIEYLDLLGDTIVIQILNDEYLTEQMGTTGANCFIAETIYTLTENDSIGFVRIKMDYGSHASPGLYSRGDYKDMVIK